MMITILYCRCVSPRNGFIKDPLASLLLNMSKAIYMYCVCRLPNTYLEALDMIGETVDTMETIETLILYKVHASRLKWYRKIL